MKITHIVLLGLACGAAPIAVRAGVDVVVSVPVPEVVIVGQPPQPRVEVISQAPGPDYFWIGGRWNYSGSRWVWMNGHYDRHPHFHAGGGWEAGHWESRGGNSVWHEGHWR
jgi:hypothetical protein